MKKKFFVMLMALVMVLQASAGVMPVMATEDSSWSVEIAYEKVVMDTASTNQQRVLTQPIQQLDFTDDKNKLMIGAEVYGTLPASGVSMINALYKGDKLESVDLSKLTRDGGIYQKAFLDTSAVSGAASDYVLKTFMWDIDGALSPLKPVKTLTAAEKKITSFTVNGTAAEIYHGTGEIKLDGTGTVTPQITVSDGATIYPASGEAINLSEGVLYTVTASDGSRAYYKVNPVFAEDAIQNAVVGTYTNARSWDKNGKYSSENGFSGAHIEYSANGSSYTREGPLPDGLSVKILEENGKKIARLDDRNTSNDIRATIFLKKPTESEPASVLEIDDCNYYADITLRFVSKPSDAGELKWDNFSNGYLKTNGRGGYNMHQTYFSNCWNVKSYDTTFGANGIAYANPLDSTDTWYTFRFFHRSDEVTTRSNGYKAVKDGFDGRYMVSKNGGEFVHAEHADGLSTTAEEWRGAGFYQMLLSTSVWAGQIIDVQSVKLYMEEPLPEYTEKTALYMVGDSLMQEYSGRNDNLQGWGKYFATLFNDEMYVENTAISGHRASFYLNGGTNGDGKVYPATWVGIKNKLKEGDYVLISIGVNDHQVNLAAGMPANNSFKSIEADITTMVNDAKAKGATPILMSEPPYKIVSDGGRSTMDEPFRHVSTATGALYFNLGTELKNKFMTLQGIAEGTTESQITEEQKNVYYCSGDNQHLNEDGARIAAEVAAELLKASDSALKFYLK